MTASMTSSKSPHEKSNAESQQTIPRDSGSVVAVSPEFESLIEIMAAKTGLDKAEVLHRAVLLMKEAIDAQAQGNKIGILDNNDQLKVEITGLGM